MKYELALVIKPLSNEDIKEKVYPRVITTIEKLNGKVSKSDYVGKKMLAYEIDGHNEGYYIFCNIELPQESAKKLNDSLKGMKDLLRFMLIDENSL